MDPLWRLLDQRSSLAGVRGSWERWLGGEIDNVGRWMRPRESLARSIPNADGRWLRVVEHDDDDMVAIDDESGAICTITQEDRVVHELDMPSLVLDIATALGAEGNPEELSHFVWRLGAFVPIAGHRFPLFLVIARGRDELLAHFGLIASQTSDPFVIVTPTDRWHNESTRSVLRDRDSASVVLTRALSIERSTMRVCAPLTDLIPTFVERHVPALSDAPTPGFPTPPGTQWSDVSIRFLDGHTVSVTVHEITRRCSYDDMGLGDRRSRQPTKQWELLRAFAARHGELSWDSPAATRRNQKRKERLGTQLQSFFGIDSDPFEYVDVLKGWKARFGIEPD